MPNNFIFGPTEKLTNRDVLERITSLPEFREWSDVAQVLFPKERLDAYISLDWQLPAISYKLLTGNHENILPAISAMACAQIAIILVDDILDEEPNSISQQIGSGRAANIALGLQAVSTLLLQQCKVSASNQWAACIELNKMLFRTAIGQDLDSNNFSTEEEYWHVVRAKSTPFYGAGLKIGTLLAGTHPTTAQEFYEIGATLGEVIQICDDLEDAFASPANPDWLQGRNNLAILYALSTEHADKKEFESLRSRCDDPSVLEQLQEILIRCGAVSYCTYQLLSKRNSIHSKISALQLDQADQFKHLLNSPVIPIKRLLNRVIPDLDTDQI